MPPDHSATIAPSKDSDDDDVNCDEFQQVQAAPTPIAVTGTKDDVSIMAVNKYSDTPDDVEEAVAAADDDESKDRGESRAAALSATEFPTHPPSFFTNERGNLKVVALVVRNPCAIFSFLIAMCYIIAFLLQVLVFRASESGSPFTLPTNEFDVNDVRSIQYDSYRLARDQVQETRKEMEVGSKVTLRQSEVSAILMWLFESEEGNDAGVFGSPGSIADMKEGFDIFMSDPSFEDYCVLDYLKDVDNATGTHPCKMPLSPLAMYYASEWDEAKAAAVIEQLSDPARVEKFNALALCYVRELYCDLVDDTTTAEDQMWAIQLGATISSIVSKWDMKGEMVENYGQVTELASYLKQVDIFRGQVDYGFDLGFSVENPVSHFSRGIVFWGGPLEDRNQTMVSGEVSEEDEKVADTEDDQVKDFIIKNYLPAMDKQSDKKTHGGLNSYYFMTAIIGDVILGIVTKDALLALISFAFVFFWLFINTRSWFLAFVGLFEIFFSIPIAWFIFTVIFRIKYFSTLNSLALFVVAAIGADDIFIFMDAYKQSQYHLDILTDLETRMSWIYRRTGKAMAITSATTCAAFLCTLITPLSGIQSFGIFAAVVIFIDYVLVMSLFCTAVIIYHNRYENNSRGGCCCPCGPVDPSNTDRARVALESGEEVKPDRVSEFFKNKVAGFIQVPLHRLAIGIVFLVWLSIAIWQASKIEATQENEEFLSEDHPLQKSLTILNNEFPTADEDIGLKVHLVWGLGQVDRTGVNRLLEPENFGQPTFVRDFDFNEQCQSDMLELCDTLKTDSQYKDLIKRKNGLGLVYCFIEELAAYNVKGDLTDCDYMRSGSWKNETWQVAQSDLSEVIPDFLKQKTCYDESGMETISGRYQDEIGWNGIGMRYAAISSESNVLDPFGQDGESSTRNEYDQFIKIAEQQGRVSQSCGGEVIMTDLNEKFVFMNNQNIYVRSALQSSILGVAIAFIVLLVSTRVFHIALFASLSIMSVLVSVLGTMVMLGWQLGSIESILIGIIAGFSVDYVVHLAHAYEVAKGDTYERITEAFGDLGISVFNGMITSVAASIPLFFCQLQFFAKFGTFLCLTIVFSWVFANFAFMSVLAQLKIPLKEKGCRL